MSARGPWKFRLRCWVRQQVVASRRLQAFWRLWYQLAEWLVILWLARFPEVRALYLRRGASKGELLPGVSDLDWTVILADMTGPRRQVLQRGYAILSRLFPFLDAELVQLSESELPDNWSHPENWYRWREARQTWKLKLGQDILAEMPELPERTWAGWHRELKVWINVWVKNLINHPWRFYDRVYRNATSFKLLSEFLKIEWACFQGRETFQRNQVLAWLPVQQVWRERLLAMQQCRFLEEGSEFAQWSFTQMLLWLDLFRQRLARSDYGCCGQQFRFQRLGQPEFADWQRVEAARVANWARQLWGDRLLSWTVSGCLCFPPDQLVLLLKVDPSNPPRLEEVRALSARTQSLELRPYLWFGASALSLSPDWNVSDNSLLSLEENPDLFLPLEPRGETGYSKVILQFFSTRWGREPAEDRFESDFWWSAQMAVYFAHACENSLVVPRSQHGIRCELELLGYPIDFELRDRDRASAYLLELWAKVKERPMHNFG